MLYRFAFPFSFKGRWRFKAAAALFFLIRSIPAVLAAGTAMAQSDNGLPAIPPKVGAIDRGLLIFPDGVRDKRRCGPAPTLVDLRPESHYRRLRIPASINLPLYAIKTKPFLKGGGEVVLFNEGYRYVQLERECRSLRRQGFSAFILNGGLVGWLHSKGAVDGDLSACKNLNRIPAEVFLQENKYENWIVVRFVDKTTAPSALFHDLPLSLLGKGEKCFAEAWTMLMDRQKTQPKWVVVLTPNGRDDDAVEARATSAGDKDMLFFLEGGMAAYDDAVMQQAWQWKDGSMVVKSPKACSVCN